MAQSSIFRKLRSWHLVPSLHGKQMGERMETVTNFILGASKITVDGDCSHEIKRHLQLGKNLPAMQETWVQSLGWEDPLHKGKATHSRILA